MLFAWEDALLTATVFIADVRTESVPFHQMPRYFELTSARRQILTWQITGIMVDHISSAVGVR